MVRKIRRILFSFLFAGLMFSNVYAYAEVNTNRIAGNSRYETSIQISKSGWTTSTNLVIATGEDFPDALCAAPLAKKLNSPILLTNKDKLDDNLISEITRLKAKNAYIIGGQGAVSDNVKSQLINMGIVCKRLSGESRYDTSLAIAKEVGNYNEAVVATGDNFPDALAIAPIAAKKNIPIILTMKSNLPETVASYLKSKNISKFYVIGGTGVISDSVRNSLPNSERLYGDNRFSTNVAILNRFSTDLDLSSAYLATGDAFPDALSGSVLAANTSSPLILVSSNLPEEIKDYLYNKSSTITKLNLLGGEGALPLVTVDSVQESLSYSKEITSDGNNSVANGAISINTEDDFYNAVKNAIINGQDRVNIITNNANLYDKYIDIVEKVVNDYADYSDYIDSWSVSNDYVQFNYSISKDLVDQKREETNKKANQIIASIIKPGMTELQKEKAIHDYIVNNSKYDYSDYLSDTISEDSYSSYGVLVKGVGVCSSYARAMMKLSRLAGLECYYVTGVADGDNHAWNILKIGGKYYHVDATFDDPVVNGGSIQMLSHEYFNISDSVIQKDHSWDRSKYPACTN